jgi:hypothetical protein
MVPAPIFEYLGPMPSIRHFSIVLFVLPIYAAASAVRALGRPVL